MGHTGRNPNGFVEHSAQMKDQSPEEGLLYLEAKRKLAEVIR